MKEGRIRPSLFDNVTDPEPVLNCLNEGGSNSTLVVSPPPSRQPSSCRLNEGGSNSTLVDRPGQHALFDVGGLNEGGSNSTLVAVGRVERDGFVDGPQ